MTKRSKNLIALTLSGVMFASAITMMVTTVLLNQKTEDKPPQNNDENKPDDNVSSDNNDDKELYPESSAELQNRTYPFASKNDEYFYMYANIHTFLYDQPEFDQIINYRYMMPDYQGDSEFLIKQDVLYKNIRQWIVKAIYQHEFFKPKAEKMSLMLDYKTDVYAKNILINAVWWFENDYSIKDHLPKRYWDQIIVKLAKLV